MKFLDEDIELQITGITVATSSTYQYVVKEDNIDIFNGRMFLQAGTAQTKTLYINEIVNNRKEVVNNLSFTTNTYRNAKDCATYSATLSIDNNTYTSNSVDVFLCYRYPNHKFGMENSVFDYKTQSGSQSLLIQGMYDYNGGNGGYTLTPRYPYKNTNKYGILMHNLFGSDLTGSMWKLVFNDAIAQNYNNAYQITAHSPVLENKINLSTLYANTSIPFKINTTDSAVDKDGNAVGYNESYRGYIVNSRNKFAFYTYDIETEDSNGIKTTIKSEESLSNVMNYGSVTINGVDNNVKKIIITIYEQLQRYPIQPRYKILEVTLSNANLSNYQHLYYDFSIEIRMEELQINKSIIYRTTKLEAGDSNINDGIIYLKRNNFSSVDIIGKIDICPKHYYLMWQDRLGSFQSQSFEKTETFSEDFTFESIKNYKNESRHSTITVTPKWKLNTKWIDEKYYPFYESIFTSPYLVLYDATEDESYIVNVIDSSYTEKTFKNQGRKLFNLELNLEENKKQTIIY